MLSSILGLYSVGVTRNSSFFPVVTTKYVSTNCQMSPVVYMWWGDGSRLRTTDLEGLTGNLVILNNIIRSNVIRMESVNCKALRITTN